MRHDGNGLSDATELDGRVSQPIFRHLGVDILTLGNHELYEPDIAWDTYTNMVPLYGGRYVTANVDIYDHSKGGFVPIANRTREFTTQDGIRILAFGFLFDFYRNCNNTRVHAVEHVIKQDWFKAAVQKSNVDIIIVAAHASIRYGNELRAVYRAIRDLRKDIPIQLFGGHSHTRDFRKYDEKAHAIESGRYCETAGWVALNGIRKRLPFQIHRRYIDFNRFSFMNHSLSGEGVFDTELGKLVSKQIALKRSELSLDRVHGCAPRDYFLHRYPFGNDGSIYNLLVQKVLPLMVVNESRVGKARMIITNSGGIRFDIFKGPFTYDSSFIVTPFDNQFLVIHDVEYSTAKRLLRHLNYGRYSVREASTRSHERLYFSQLKDTRQRAYYGNIQTTPGYTTVDDLGDDGDDTVHSKIPQHPISNCIQGVANFPSKSDPKAVDLIFVDFIKPNVLRNLKYLGADVEEKDVHAYLGANVTLTSMMREYAERYWTKYC